MLLNLLIKKTRNIASNASTKAINSIINKNISSLNIASSSSSNFLNPKRHYTSLKLGHNSNKKFTIVFSQVTSRRMSTTPVNFKLEKRFDNIITSSQDKRLYRGLLLDNDLKCLLISDPATDRSAASVDVHAGYMLDPKEFPGLAHFCEHMLFMGSKKVNLTDF